MRRIETTVNVRATPQRVWNVLTDFARYSDWSPTMTITGTPSVGERLELVAAAPGEKGMRFNPTVLDADPGRVLRWKGKVLVPGLCDGVHEFVLDAHDGGTRVTHAEDFSGVLVPFLGGSLKQTEQRMHDQNTALKRQAERDVA